MFRVNIKILIFVVISVVVITAGVLVAVAVNNRGDAPVAWWKFDEGYGSTAYDASSNTNTGAITNATWQNEESCKTSKCLYFDGTDDYVSIPDFALE